MTNDVINNDIDEDDDEDTLKDKYLTFHLGKEEYGIAISYVSEVVGIQKITEMPDVPDFIKGVINLRGQVIPVNDVRLRFKMEAKPYDERTCIIVINVDGIYTGLIVDTVNDVIKIPEDNVQPPIKIKQKENSHFIHGLGKVNDEVKILLNVQKLLFDDMIDENV